MNIVGMTDGDRRVLILDTGQRSPSRAQWALFLSRSVTMLGEYYLLDGKPVDAEGNIIPPENAHKEALAAVSSEKEGTWRRFAVPDMNTLLSLN